MARRGVRVESVPGAVKALMPGFIKPQLATLKTKAPVGEQWVHEIKFDGYRLQAHAALQRVTLFTRNGYDWTNRFASVAAALKRGPQSAIFDGEVIVEKDGRPNFSELQAALAAGTSSRMIYYIFDLLYLNGYDLRGCALADRKGLLRDVLANVKRPIRYSEHLTEDGATMFRHACMMNLEGIISKNATATYRSERNENWLKVKCVQRERFPVIGFIKEVDGISALYLGREVDGELTYAGKVGTGFTRKSSMDVRKRLQPLVTPHAKLAKRLKKPKATWVEPKLYADVEFRDITSEGQLRHSSFKGLTDKRN
jgi:bifunctional non-homologous end joining protein LigD